MSIKSDRLDITAGVSRSSILGPLISIIYINDIMNVSNIFYFIIYADDATLSSVLSSFKTCNTIEGNINNQLSKVSECQKVNKFS